jgi:hypothetical protein
MPKGVHALFQAGGKAIQNVVEGLVLAAETLIARQIAPLSCAFLHVSCFSANQFNFDEKKRKMTLNQRLRTISDGVLVVLLSLQFSYAGNI